MINIELAQFGAGGISWLFFTLGLVWCSFSWWRVHRCKIALASALTALGTCVGIILLVVGTVAVSFGFSRIGGGNDMQLIGQLFLGFLVLVTCCWTASALLFLIAVRRLRMSPEDYISTVPANQSPHAYQ